MATRRYAAAACTGVLQRAELDWLAQALAQALAVVQVGKEECLMYGDQGRSSVKSASAPVDHPFH